MFQMNVQNVLVNRYSLIDVLNVGA
jgi:hypothetical protein